MENIGNHIKYVVFDLTRAAQQSFNYGLVEQLKNGITCCQHYHFRDIEMDQPKIIIFSNQPLIQPFWSQDRYDCWKIKPQTMDLIPHHVHGLIDRNQWVANRINN